MVIGYLFGRDREHFSDMKRPLKSYNLVKQLHDQYVEKYGTCRSYDVQKTLMGRTYNLWNPDELKEASQSGMMKHCLKVVGTIAQQAVELILAQEINLDKFRISNIAE
jgi:hypothetical protein